MNGGILLSYVDGGGTSKRTERGGKPRKAKTGAGGAKGGAKARSRGKSGGKGIGKAGKKSGKPRRSR